MIDDGEVIAGLTFLERYARPEMQPAIRDAIAGCAEVIGRSEVEKKRALSIDNLEISIRLHASLIAMGCRTVGELESLMGKGDEEILSLGKRHHFGKKCLREAREALKSVGLEAGR